MRKVYLIGLLGLLVLTGCIHHLFPPYFAAKPAHFSPLPPPGPGRTLNLEAEEAKARSGPQRATRAKALLSVSAPAVVLAWDVSSDAAVVGYKVYQGTASRDYTNSVNVVPGTNNGVVIGPLATGITYFFAATAYTAGGLESEYSGEVSYQVPVGSSNVYFAITTLGSTNINGTYTVYGTPTILTNPPGPQLFFKVSISPTNF